MSSHARLLLSATASALLLAACAAQQSSKSPASAPGAKAAAATTVAPPALIPRKLLFGNPERAAGEISPDGRWLGYVAPDDGVLNVFVAPRGHPDQAKVITHDRKRGVRSFNFAYDGKHLLYPQDEGGNENFHIYSVDLDSGKQTDLTPFKKARADLAGLTPKHPHDVLVNANDRNAKYFDPIRIDLRSGKRERLIKNDSYAGFTTDDDFNLRLASKSLADGSSDWFRRSGKAWKPYGKVPQADSLSTNALGFTRDGKTLYLLDSRERDTAALFAVDWTSGKRSVVHEDAHADVGGIFADPKTGAVRAVAVDYLRNEWTVLDPAIQKDFDYLKTLGDGEVNVVSQSDDDKFWVVVLTRSDASPKYYLYDRAAGNAAFWFDTRPALAQTRLAVMHPVEIPARDGLKLVSYYTLPTEADPSGSGKATRPVPMVLFVHGGPWGRDGYGYNAYHQWLANRGYAVLSVNYRASTGFGKAFVNAGDLQWGRKMHDDLIDAVDWAIKQGITSKDKVAIMGGSYGGYATLAGVTMTPDEFACGVDIVGPSNLFTLLQSIPPYWTAFRAQFYTRMGNPDTEDGRALLKERSPLTYADKIVKPLLIGQGKNDPRVNVNESEQIVKAMQAKNIPVTYVLYPDEGHGFRRPENNTSFNAVAEDFLANKCLGGRSEPIGNDFSGSTITVPAGADLVPGLAAALAAKK
ncbi:MAG TPA: S9 family peptidase [Rudaea sp.]|jgi:dipeptidyl aminopeptidase/acylaminoacyl peptidase